MASSHQPRGRSRNRSGGRSSEHTDRSLESTPKAGSKRLFSNRESRQLNGSQTNDKVTPDTADGGGGGEGRHSDKRHRSSDWPLSNPSPNSISSSAARRPLHNRKTPNSPSSSHRSRARSLIRPSKFVEGSMNDRVSQVPPVPYLEPEDEFLSEYNTAGCGEGARGRKLTRSRMFTHHPNVSVAESSANQSDASRSSSIFRFGKSIAASFNPTNWKFWSKEQQEEEEEDEEAAQLRILHERQAKAEKIYQELKESGHFRDSAVTPRLFPPPPPISERKVGKHDSGIEFGDLDMSGASTRGSTSIEEKRKGRIFLELPKVSQQRGESPGSNYSASVAQSNTSTPNKPKFNFKKPSLANLKKASLSNIKSAFAGDSSLSVNDHQARRIPSRKDLQKQQKLVKRVSNLEERLKQARQQLAEALNEPLPSASPVSQVPSRVSRSRFVPGALSSLPSERLLSGYVSSEAGFSDDEMRNGIGQAVSTDHVMSNTHFMSGGLGREQTKAVEQIAGSLFTPEAQQDDTVIQSVEDGSPALLEPNPASIEDNLQDAEVTPTKPKDTEMAKDEDEEVTPKPKSQSKPAEHTKKRKSIFERVPDDGGDYTPSRDEDDGDDLADDVVSDVSSISKPKHKSTSTSTKASKTSTTRGKGPTITLQHPRKLQKTVPGPKATAKTTVSKTSPPSKIPNSVSSYRPSIPPPTRAAPPPPPPSQKKFQNNHITSPPPSARLMKMNKATLLPTNRQQSASPPPSSATFTGPGLNYKKPSQRQSRIPSKAPSTSRHNDDDDEEDDAYIADPALSPSIPPLPPMPKAVRLASGEVVSTAGMVKNVSGTASSNGGVVNRETRERAAGMTASSSKQSFEWPDDVF
ncbi:hypothetical protein ONS95_010546 [Cadophora gregata]|uniref:uncharacterized protein n=1 Tax=Cadophora gregata TaxID=51156 RepID=UPI0026DD2780|nr:uncharacterized protein ONS95_010546 [Cadophora gregata]KAK0122300.1 hypothetical protein ONS95_010546 [Cadophora gregata]KAK0127774.1 hypothetical protein ONS96_007285 [Cadophora gregata f. sp. sojae]